MAKNWWDKENWKQPTIPGYTPGASVTGAWNAYTSALGGRPNPYASQYQDEINGIIGQIENVPDFNYDVNADALYQMYKSQYTRNGQRAMQDTIGQASAMTGGYGNTYAASAGQQQYQNYMGELNSVIPELEGRAYGRYRDDIAELYNQYGMYANQENTDYGRYRDTMSDWWQGIDFTQGAYADAQNFDYNAQQPKTSGGGGGSKKQQQGVTRTADDLRAADAYMRGGAAALDDYLRSLEQEGVPAQDLMMLRFKIMRNYKPDPDRIKQATEGMGDGKPIPGGR